MATLDWDRRLEELADPVPLLQSHGWGEVQAAAGWRVERVDLGSVCFQALIRGYGRLRLVSVARGPLPAGPAAVEALVEWSRRRGASVLRVEPQAPPELAGHLERIGFTEIHVPPRQPEHTWIVRLGPEPEMLAAARPKTRYNIRLGLRSGVLVEEGDAAAELARQVRATAGRQGINLPGENYYRLVLERLPWARVLVARHQGLALAAILVARHHTRLYYLFGGSTGEHRQLMPNHLLHWRAMQIGVALGCREYDLWGISPGPAPDHPLAGLWQFKSGFGGGLESYPGQWQLVLDRRGEALIRLVDGARRRLSRAWLAAARRPDLV